jgi:cation:H+ antiporter
MILDPLDFVRIVVGLVGLFIGGDWLVKGAARLAAAFKISPLVIGLTIVAYGTGTPEMLVSVQAALRGSADIATGNIVGSNISNTGLILGASALIYPMVVHGQFLRRELPIMIGVSVSLLLCAADGTLSQLEGLLFVIGLAIFTVISYWLARRERQQMTQEALEFEAERSIIDGRVNILIEIGRVLVGIGVLVVASDWLVAGASNIARALGVSELVIGITLVAVGTSLPELATSLVAAFRKESEIAIGNVVGSNIFNILGILGVTATLSPVTVNPQLIRADIPIMIGFAGVLFVLVLNGRLSRWRGGLLLLGYVAFVTYAFLPR